MTTDTHKKEYAIQFELGGKTCTVGAIGKGSGMIAPQHGHHAGLLHHRCRRLPPPCWKRRLRQWSPAPTTR